MNKIKPGCEPILLKGNRSGCLLLHGLSSTPFEMHFLADHLSKIGYTVSVPLLPGHGTEPEDLINLSWYNWFAHVKEALFELRKKVRKIYIVGQSMGAALALHLAAHYEVDGIVALAPGLYLKKKRAHLINPLLPFLRYYYKSSGSDIKSKVPTLSYNKIPLRAIREMLKLFDHLKQDLPDIYSPTLIIYSAQDHVVDSRSATTIYERISAKDKRILRLENSYHVITLDLEKDKVFREVENFISHLEG